MTELYRGLLTVLTDKFNNLIETLRKHIRSFRKETKDQSIYFDVGIIGFWNLMLEIFFTLFVFVCLLSGILLTAVLAIVAYPFAAILNYSSLLLKGVRNPKVVHDEIQIVKLPNDKEKI